MKSMDEALRDELTAIDTAQRYRRRRVVQVIDTASPVHISVDGQECVNFCSNDYLGLSGHVEVRKAMSAAVARHGVGSGAAHLVTGHSHEHHALEEELAEFIGRPRALLFSTGYMANLGIASALLRKGDVVLEDRLNHASLLDAGRFSEARFARYKHNDANALSTELARHAGKRCVVMTDAVFSMDGDIAPLAELVEACVAQQAWLAVDDAHGFGVLGEHGRGSVQAAGLTQEQVPIYMATLGKAIGSFGAFVAGSNELIETLIQKARTYIYTTALPPAVAAASRAALKLIRSDDTRRQQLHAHIARFQRGMQQLGMPLLPSSTAIQPIVLGDDARALAMSAALLEQGFLVAAIRPPTVPAGTARLRITLSAAHSESDIDHLLDALNLLRRLPA